MDQDLREFKENVERVTSEVKAEFLSLRGSRPTVKLVEDIKVEIYDQRMTVKQLGSIAIAPPREINISLWDKATVPAVSKAVTEALDLNPSIEGTLLRINLPPLTEERKKDIIKVTSKIAEAGRIKIRSLRDAINKKIEQSKEAGDITEDDKFLHKEQAQKTVDEANKKIESLLADKVEEIKS